jgi:hypothetical protein
MSQKRSKLGQFDHWNFIDGQHIINSDDLPPMESDTSYDESVIPTVQPEWPRAAWEATQHLFQGITTRLEDVLRGRDTSRVREVDLQGLVPPLPVLRRGVQPYLHWIVPVGVRLLDPRLLRLHRLRYTEVPVPLVIEHEVPSGQARTLLDDARAELSWTLEMLWQMVWNDVPAGAQPGLVLIDPPFGVAACTPLEPRLRPTLAALATSPIVTTDHLAAAASTQDERVPSSAERSRTLRALHRQGLLAPLEPGGAPLPRSPVRRGKRPLVYASLIAHLLARRYLLWASPKLPQVAGFEDPQSILTAVEPHFTSMVPHWQTYADKLREKGLRTI